MIVSIGKDINKTHPDCVQAKPGKTKKKERTSEKRRQRMLNIAKKNKTNVNDEQTNQKF